MVNWYDLLLYILFGLLGACLMRWADIRVEQAVEAERRGHAAYLRRGGAGAVPGPRVIPPMPDDGRAPLPLQLDARDEQALRADGAVVKTRMRRTT